MKISRSPLNAVAQARAGSVSISSLLAAFEETVAVRDPSAFVFGHRYIVRPRFLKS